MAVGLGGDEHLAAGFGEQRREGVVAEVEGGVLGVGDLGVGLELVVGWG